MKILMTTDTVGGVWTYTMELCAALRNAGLEIELASLGRELSAEQWREVSALSHVRVHESSFKLCWMEEPWADVERSGEWLLKLERELAPDLIHLNDLGLGGFAWRAPVVLVAHSCVFSWWEAVKKQPPDVRQWSRYRAAVRRSVKNADWLVAPSRAILDRVLHHYGPARVSLVIPNGRNYPPLAQGGVSAGPTRLDAPGPAGGEQNKPLIFAAGRLWDEAKNIASLVSIADQLDWPLHIAGETAEPGRADTRSEAAGGTCYLGFLDKPAMAYWLHRASIYVAPAYYEPFGLGILEAARAGCALVLGDIPSLREVWADAAVYVAPDDARELRKAINEVINNPRRRRQLAARAWQRAQAYSSERMAGDYLQCYRSLVHDPAALAAPTGRAAAAASKRL